MKSIIKFFGIIAFAALIVIGFTACGNALDAPPIQLEVPTDEDTDIPIRMHSIRATTEPTVQPINVEGSSSIIRVPRTGNGLIDSFTEGGANFFLIDMGIVRNSYIATLATAAHRTSRTEFLISNVSREILEETSLQSITNSVTLTDTKSNTQTAGVSVSITSKIPFTKSATLRGSWKGSWTNGHSQAATNAQTLQTSETRIQEMTQVVSTNRIMDHTDPHGIYRYAIYAVKRIFFIVETPRDNSRVISTEPIVVVQSVVRDLTFCEHGIFDNAPEQTLDLEYGFQEFLPIPAYPPTELLYTLNISSQTVDRVPIPNVATFTINQISDLSQRTYIGRHRPNTSITMTAHPVPGNPLPTDPTLLKTWYCGYKFFRWEVVSGADIADENNADTTITLSGDATIRAIFHRTFPDTRSGAGQTYRIVRIGELEWMAENLRFAGHSTSDNRISWCYSSNTPNHVCFPVCSRCNRYGRMYNYLAAAAHNAGQPRGEMSCPPGWRLPVCREWDAMRDLIGTANAGNILKSREGWNQVNANGLNGSDRFGFSALPGGLRADTQLEGFGVQGRWWSATSGGSNSYRFREMRSDSNQMTTGTINRNRVLSVRCVRD